MINTILYIMISSVLVLLLVFGILFLVFYNKHKKTTEELMKYEININATIDENIPKILDTYITEVFNEYRIKHFEFKEAPFYINKEEEKKMLEDIAQLCGDRISSNMIDKLSLFWDTKELGSIIAEKIETIVMTYVVTNNAVKYDDSDKK